MSANVTTSELSATTDPLVLQRLFRDFRSVIADAVETTGSRAIMEIGAGRTPLFGYETAAAAGIGRYVLNDVDPDELARASCGVPDATVGAQHALKVETACFDICGQLAGDAPRDLDFVFSRSVLEHVPDTAAAYRNIHQILRPGGVMFHFYPTLYAAPFVVNRVLPEAAADRVLRIVRPRDRERAPKFPATYSLCRSTESVARTVRELGFGEVVIKPFYTHPYYRRIPPLHAIHTRAARLYERRDWRALSAYAVLVARK